MPTWIRKTWPVLRWLLALAILFAVGRSFLTDLRKNPDLWRQPLHFGWTALSGVLYLVALGLFACYWMLLLRRCGQRPSWLGAGRAYFVGMLGKYLPGKAWALVFRAGLAANAGIPVRIAAATSFGEVLTTMSAAVLVAAILFAVLADPATPFFDSRMVTALLKFERPATDVVDRGTLVALSVLLFFAVAVPIAPPVFNVLVERLTRRFRKENEVPVRIAPGTLLTGLGICGCGWMLMGVSLGAGLLAVLGQPAPFAWQFWAWLIASMGLAYVAGFVIFIVPSGLGVREFFLTWLLAPEISRQFDIAPDQAAALAVMGVLWLRLTWTVAEAISAAAVFWLPSAVAKDPAVSE